MKRATPGAAEPSMPFWEAISGGEPAPAEGSGVTMRLLFAAGGATGPLDGSGSGSGSESETETAARAHGADLSALIDHTPSAPIELPGSPTIAMAIEPYEARPVEAPHDGQTLPWPAIYPYDRIALANLPQSEPAMDRQVPPDREEGTPLEVPQSAPPAMTAEAREPLKTDASPLDPSGSAAAPVIHEAPAAGPDRADELLQRFAASSGGDTNMKATAKGLRALAGIDLTPSMSAMPPALACAGGALDAFGEAPHAAEDVTPPATSPGFSTVPPPRGSMRRLARNVAAFAVGLAGATLLVHFRPSFPDEVTALLTHAIPAADPPSPPPESPTTTDQNAEPRAHELRPPSKPASITP